MIEPITPDEAVQQYLTHRKTDLAESSHQNHRYRLERFLEWCEEEGIDNMNSITGRAIHTYTQARAEEVASTTLRAQLSTIRSFLRFCERIEAVPEGVSEKTLTPSLNYGDEVQDGMLTAASAEAIQEYLRTFEYVLFRHALFETLWHTGVWMGTARAFDVADYHSEDQYLEVVHRPETGTTGTPLKNKERGERYINLSADVCDVLDDFLDVRHPHVEDEHGGVPLFGTETGRAGKTVIQKNIYAVMRPCHYTNECPYDREIEECEAVTDYGAASKCPSSVSPHPVRRGAITVHLNADVPKEVPSDCMDVSVDTLDKHYDGRMKAERRKQRRQHLNEL